MAKKNAGRTPKQGGAEAIRERGEVGILIPVSPEHRQLFKVAAAAKGVPMNQFIRDAALKEAQSMTPIGWYVFRGLDFHTVCYMDANGGETAASGRQFFSSQEGAEEAAERFGWKNAEFAWSLMPRK